MVLLIIFCVASRLMEGGSCEVCSAVVADLGDSICVHGLAFGEVTTGCGCATGVREAVD